MTKKICIFTVTGPYRFPIDMLRYDCCYPQQQIDTAAIEKSLLRERPGPFKVTLASQIIYNPTKDRWASFGWTVTDVTMI